MNEKNLVLVLGLAGFVVMADSWVVSPILPAIAHSLKIGPVRAGLLITAYVLPFGRSQLLFGPLADRYGKRRVISFSTTFFAIGTGLCTYINIVEVQPGLGLGQPNFGRCFSSRTPRPSISS